MSAEFTRPTWPLGSGHVISAATVYASAAPTYSQTVANQDYPNPFLTTPGPRSSLLAPVPEVAVESGLTSWTVYELIRQDRLPPGIVVRFGPRTTRINRAKWKEFVEAGGLEQPR